jgi:hypothetical protein
MELKREIVKYLREWRVDSYRKPLVLRGARQVGKTTLVKQFARDFKNFIWLNLERPNDLRYFNKDQDVRDILEIVLANSSVKSDELNDTLLFIDEIQESPYAIQLLRYFYEDFPELCVIAAGSLLEFAFENVRSMPVGRIEYLYVFPLSFREYLIALGNDVALNAFDTVPVSPGHAKVLKKLFHRFLIIGGLPEIVKLDIEKENLADLAKIYDAIWQTYIDDVQKYSANDKEKEVASYLLRVAPGFVDQRVKFQGFGGSDYKSREVKSAFLKLEYAKVIRLIRPATNVDFPVFDNLKKAPRLQFLDTGLVNNALGIQPQLIGVDDLSSAYKGAVIPHMITQELLSRSVHKNAQPNFWVREKNQSSAEVDLVYAFNQLVIPIEIKSGPKGTLKSLHQFIDMADHIYAVRIYAGEFKIEMSRTPASKEYLLMNLPYFLGARIPEYIRYFVENFNSDSFLKPYTYPETGNDGVEMVLEANEVAYVSKLSSKRIATPLKSSGFDSSSIKNDGVNWPDFIEVKTDKVKNELLKLIGIIGKEQGLRANTISQKIGKSIPTTERYLKLLKKAGLIVFRGSPKWGGYFPAIKK